MYSILIVLGMYVCADYTVDGCVCKDAGCTGCTGCTGDVCVMDVLGTCMCTGCIGKLLLAVLGTCVCVCVLGVPRMSVCVLAFLGTYCMCTVEVSTLSVLGTCVCTGY